MATPTAVFLWSRAGIWVGAIFAYLWFVPHPPPLADSYAGNWDRPEFHDLGYGIDVWARWDSEWFVKIAHHGYGVADGAAAFFPLYPGLMAFFGRAFYGHYVLAAVLISLAAAWGCFVLLHRLARRHLGDEDARRALVYLALFPMALFLQAAYSESLFLLLALAVFLLAERGSFAWAGVALGLALLTRPTAVALIPAAVLIAWPSLRSMAKLLPGMALFAAYPLLLWQTIGDPWAWFGAEKQVWGRQLLSTGPFGGLWWALSRWHPVNTDIRHSVAVNLECWAFLLLFVALTVVAWRRLGAPYGIFAAVSILMPVSTPPPDWPLESLPRFGLVVFPFFLALAVLGRRPQVHTTIVVTSALLLGIALVQWTQYQWVA
ncbi:MAG: mannosyltransferase family protein [Gaiellaceae bacterium]